MIMINFNCITKLILLLGPFVITNAFLPNGLPQASNRRTRKGKNPSCITLFSSSPRRSFIIQAATGLSSIQALTAIEILHPSYANASIDPATLKDYKIEGDISGVATRLSQIEATRNRPSDLTDIPFEELPSGVSYREYREGKGGEVIKPGSKVAVEMTIRCKSFSTAKEPGGVKYFSTKTDTDFNEVAWIIGSGELPPGLEEGMMGMRRSALRRIEIPSTMVFEAKKMNQLPLPIETNKDGKKLFEERLFKTDATLLFEVFVTRIK